MLCTATEHVAAAHAQCTELVCMRAYESTNSMLMSSACKQASVHVDLHAAYQYIKVARTALQY